MTAGTVLFILVVGAAIGVLSTRLFERHQANTRDLRSYHRYTDRVLAFGWERDVPSFDEWRSEAPRSIP